MELLTDIFMAAAMVVALVILGVAAWGQWTKRTPEEKADLIAEEARRVVEWAEETFKDDAGSTKFGKVLNRLMRRFPDRDIAVLEEHIQQAVLRMKGSQAARTGASLNGKHDAK